MAETNEPKKYTYAVGRRKTAVASVKLFKGTGEFHMVDKKIEPQSDLLKPLQLADAVSKYDIVYKVTGGGVSSQTEAIRLAISRALVKINPEFRLTLKKSGLLTRDPREKERKKCGLKRARKAPQWSKR